MDVLKYRDADGNWFLEIVTRAYHSLKELEAEHKKLGRKTWFNLFNSCEGSWSLTVLMGK